MASDKKYLWRVTIGPNESERLVLSETKDVSGFTDTLNKKDLDDIAGEAEVLKAEYVGQVDRRPRKSTDRNK